MPRKMGGTTRKEREKAREDAFFADKFNKAGSDPAARAAVAYDQLRAAVGSLPFAERDAAWQRVHAGLDELRADITGK